MYPVFTFDQLEFYDCKSLKPIMNNLKRIYYKVQGKSGSRTVDEGQNEELEKL